ncbi:vWA domain-containing protein [Solitalea lacus]|uniref:vWA domain-containing protein n=1 Tax=Solitalea lacus TaxID=2911172 RepID=UPI001EDA2F69|nr:BatA and WFA domain-containing protein [Solitalea lacus]UKJ05765.1 BatA and WFA domain-containing protein [Solitalea lacus]
MNFLYPSFLFALSAIAIPIVIHLFNFRKFKRVPFTNVRFLKEIKQQTDSRSRLKHLLILTCRILGIIFLVLAFAQPILPTRNTINAGKQHVYSVYIDNSNSMDARNTEGNLLDEAKRKARSIAASAGLNDRFQLLTNDFEGRHQRLIDKEAFLRFIDEVKISPNKRRVDEVIARQKDLLSASGGGIKHSYLISDFQRNSIDESKLLLDTTLNITAIPVEEAKTVNISVDSVWFISPLHKVGETEQLIVKLRNFTDEDASSVPLKLFINGVQKAIGSVAVKAKSSATDTLNFKPEGTGWQKGEVQITDFPVTFDDKLFFSYQIDQKVNVLEINGNITKNYVQTVYQTDDYFQITSNSESQIDYQVIPQQRLVVLDQLSSVSGGLAQQLNKFVQSGGSVLLFPSFSGDVNSYNSFLTSLNVEKFTTVEVVANKTEKINLQSAVFTGLFETIPQNIDLPFANRYFNTQTSSNTRREVLLGMQGGKPLLSVTQVGLGKVYLATIPLNDSITNLPRHAIFVPMMYKIAMLGSQRYPLYYTIGKSTLLETAKLPAIERNEYKLKSKDLEFIPDIRNDESKSNLYVDDQVKKDGIYNFVNGNEQLACFAFNYDRSESDLSYYTGSELEKVLEAKNIAVLNAPADVVGKALQVENSGRKLWKYCILLTLLFLGSEVLLIRYFEKLQVNVA